jgi:dethiobiotin synthetase
MKGFFVAGTDTGVGKTEVARALCALLARRGLRPVPLKPVETGCDPDAPPDALALREACGRTDLPLDRICPYRFRMPAAPLIAAEAEESGVDLSVVENLVERAGFDGVPIVVEAAGGLLVPLARPALTNIDLVQRLRLPVVLVARAGLGTLNHSALSFEALSRRGLEVAAIVLNRIAGEDDPTVASNPRWVSRMTGARVLGPSPFLSDPRARLGALCAMLDPLVDTSPVRR